MLLVPKSVFSSHAVSSPLRPDAPEKCLLIVEKHKGSHETYCTPGVLDTQGRIHLPVLLFPFSEQPHHQGSRNSEQASQNEGSDVFTLFYINSTHKDGARGLLWGLPCSPPKLCCALSRILLACFSFRWPLNIIL